MVRRGEEEAANWKKRLAESEDAARKGNDEAAALRRQYAELQVGKLADGRDLEALRAQTEREVRLVDVDGTSLSFWAFTHPLLA